MYAYTFSREVPEPTLKDLADRLTKLESTMRPEKHGNGERSEYLSVLIENLLAVLQEETVQPRSRWSDDDTTSVINSYCEVLWENAIDSGMGRYADSDKYEECEWLKRQQRITELALGLRTPFRRYHWKR